MVVNQVDHFNLTWNSSITDSNAMTILNLLEHSNGSFPSFTYDELAIPMIELQKDQKGIATILEYNGPVSLSVQLPVVRGSLNCTVIPKHDFRVVANPFNNSTECEELSCGYGVSGDIPDFTLNVNSQPSSYCNLPGRFDEQSALNYSLKLIYLNDDDDGAIERDFNGGIQRLTGCPSLAYTLGYFSADTNRNYTDQDTTDKDNVTTFVCSQYLEESTTDVHFLLPSMSIDTARPPVFNTSNSRIISTDQYDITAYTSQLSNYPLYGFSRPSPYSGVMAPLDTFTEIVLSGIDGIPPAELVHNADADRLVDAVQHVYRLYMAQAINANMRQNLTTSSQTKRARATDSERIGSRELNATLIDPTRTRVVQNNVSAIVLESLLGLILVLSIAAYSTTRLNGILPHNPCSIAGVMSLLADSRLCGSNYGLLRDVGQLRNDKEKVKVFRAWRYSLGWWDADGKLIEKGER